MDGKKEEKTLCPVESLGLDKMVDLAYEIIEKKNKISVILIMKKFNVNEEMAKKVCCKAWLKQHLEAKKLCSLV
jgi:hypothetical protein